MQTILRKGPFVAAAACLVLLALIVARKRPPDFGTLAAFPWSGFKTIFISILLEAVPFVLLGVLVSALLQVFVSERTVRRWTPRHPALGVLFACTLGIVFPLCECGMIPIVRRLMRKGMPVYIAVTFILAGPILNPVVYASTFAAFRSHPEMAYSRMGLAFLVAAAIGLLVRAFVRRSPLKREHPGLASGADEGGGGRHDHGRSARGAAHVHGAPGSGKLAATFGHASDEFFEMGKYLLIGAMLTAVIQSAVERESLAAIGQGAWSSHLFMMGFAYLLSLCSTSDAFVASSFASTFTSGSLLTFLVFGPMLDLKNTLMLLSVFRVRFVLALAALLAAAVLTGSRLFELYVLN
ncbi:permease [Paenibacillus sp. GYB003]|uniref:permease n=1 Tax=Paenibacillus sp. GYB003 TaxID=2994392 RepID=UPI002F960C56